MWVELRCTWLEPGPSGICVPSIVGCFGVHEDDFQDVTSKSDGELMKADFWGITDESDIEPMLSHNQLKVGGSFCRDDDRGEIGAEVLT